MFYTSKRELFSSQFFHLHDMLENLHDMLEICTICWNFAQFAGNLHNLLEMAIRLKMSKSIGGRPQPKKKLSKDTLEDMLPKIHLKSVMSLK